MNPPTLRQAILSGLALVLLPCSAVAAPPSPAEDQADMANLQATQQAVQVAFSEKLDAHHSRRTSAMFDRQVRVLTDAGANQPVASPAKAAPADDRPGTLSCTVSPGDPLVCDVDTARSASRPSLRIAGD